MNNERLPELASDLKSFEAQLAGLVPSPGAGNRDQLMYRAGWEACRAANASGRADLAAASPKVPIVSAGVSWLWPLSTASLLLIAIALSANMVLRQPRLQVVYVDRPAAPAPVASVAQNGAAPQPVFAAGNTPGVAEERTSLPESLFSNNGDYFSLRKRVLAFGVDAIPTGVASTDTVQIRASDSRYGVLVNELRGG